MSVSLTLTLPDLQPDTVRAAVDALFLGAPGAPRSSHRAAMLALSRGLDSFQVSYGTLRLDVEDWLHLALGMDAEVSFGAWTVEIEGVSVETWRSVETPNGTHRVTVPKPVVVEPPPAPARDDAPPTPDDDMPF